MHQFLLSSPAKAGGPAPAGLTSAVKVLRLTPAWTPAFAGEQVEA